MTSAVEINIKAFEQLKSVCIGRAYLSSTLAMNTKIKNQYDLVFTKGGFDTHKSG